MANEETLTAAERALVPSGGAYMSTKLLRLYDAALSRAEAAETDAVEMQQLRDRCWERGQTLLAQRSRLAAATALLARVKAECLRVCPDGTGSVHLSTAALWPILSATPAQAAEPRYGYPTGRDDLRVEQAAEPGRFGYVHDLGESPDEHPDTLALRECRAELERMQSQKSALARRVLELEDIKPLLDGLALESARAERDSWNRTAEKLQTELTAARAERDTALADLKAEQLSHQATRDISAIYVADLNDTAAEAKLRTALARIAELAAALASRVDIEEGGAR